MNEKCSVCQTDIVPNTNFCSNCGARIESANASLTLAFKLRILFVSVLLAPFGLIFFFKFYKSESKNKKKWAYIALVLTLISTAYTILLVSTYIKTVGSYTDIYSGLYGL